MGAGGFGAVDELRDFGAGGAAGEEEDGAGAEGDHPFGDDAAQASCAADDDVAAIWFE